MDEINFFVRSVIDWLYLAICHAFKPYLMPNLILDLVHILYINIFADEELLNQFEFNLIVFIVLTTKKKSF